MQFFGFFKTANVSKNNAVNIEFTLEGYPGPRNKVGPQGPVERPVGFEPEAFSHRNTLP